MLTVRPRSLEGTAITTWSECLTWYFHPIRIYNYKHFFIGEVRMYARPQSLLEYMRNCAGRRVAQTRLRMDPCRLNFSPWQDLSTLASRNQLPKTSNDFPRFIPVNIYGGSSLRKASSHLSLFAANLGHQAPEIRHLPHINCDHFCLLFSVLNFAMFS